MNPQDLRTVVNELSTLIAMDGFSRARETFSALVREKVALHREPEEHRFGIVKDLIETQLHFGKLNDRFIQFICFDLTGLGIASFFLDLEGWFRITLWGKTKTQLILSSDETIEFPVGALLGMACQGMSEICNTLQTRLDEQFPIFYHQWNCYVVECVIPPIISETWLRLSRREEILKRWPYAKLPS